MDIFLKKFQINRKLEIAYLIASLLISSGCWPEKKEVEIQVEAFSDHNTPIPRADVLINQKIETKTDQYGRAVFVKKIRTDERIAVEVRKESSTRYYAPFFQSFSIQDEDAPKIRVKAILYSVPKPSPDAESKITEENESNSAPTGSSVPQGINQDTSSELETASPNLKDHVNSDQNQATKASSESKEDQQKNSEVTIEPDQELKKISELPEIKPVSVITPLATVEKAKEPVSDNQEKLGNDLLNFYAFHGNRPLDGVEIYLGYADEGQLKLVCKTNRAGRCLFHSPKIESKKATVVARKKNYQTSRKELVLNHGDRIRLNMPQGETIDIFAIHHQYGYSRGLENVEVYINGKTVGKTDPFGNYSYFYKGKPGELVEVTLKSQNNYLPRVFTTDYVIAGPMSLVRYFSLQSPPPIRIAAFPLQAAGSMEGKTLPNFGGDIDQMVRNAMSNHFFKSSLFEEVMTSKLNEHLEKHNLNLIQLSRNGWQDTTMKGWLDAVMIPTLILQEPLSLELSLIDSRGKVLVADKYPLVNDRDQNAISYASKRLAEKIINHFPFEGTIIGKDDELLRINLTNSTGHQVRVGQELSVYGLQTDPTGQNKIHTKIGRVMITQILKDYSLVRIVETAPRSLIDVGDQVKIEEVDPKTKDHLKITVIEQNSNETIRQANAYFNQQWIGSTDQNGKLLVTKDKIKGEGVLHLIKHGFRDFTKEINLSSLNQIEVKMVRESAFLRVNSEPPGAEVFVDQQKIGKTPLEKPIPIPAGFIKLEIIGPPNYKVFQQILELDEGTLDLTSDRTVQLERDYRTEAKQLIDRGDIKGAIGKLQSVPKEHSDYLISQHEIGELYLSILNEPAKAAAAFHKATSHPEVINFNDKRFIGSHVNEGVALFMSGSKLEGESEEAAVAHYQKAIEVLQRVEPQLRHINRLEFSQASHNVGYYKALSQYKIWEISQDPIYLTRANQSWRQYLDHTSKAIPLKNSDSLVQNASIYFRQTEASLKQISKMKASDQERF